MSSVLLSIFAALGVVIIITILGLLLTQILINRTNKIQQQDRFIDIDNLSGSQQKVNIAVISNDVIESNPHHHRHLMKKTVSIIDQDAQIKQSNTKNITREQIDIYKDLITSIKTDTNEFSSDTSLINPLTDKITLDY